MFWFADRSHGQDRQRADDRDRHPSRTEVLTGVLAAPGLLTEDQVKAAARDALEADGWAVQVAWAQSHGVDIAGSRGGERLYLEAKGEAANPPQQVNYFLGALGELLQRMDDVDAQYGLALPDNRQYRGLLKRLPDLVWTRLNFLAVLVAPTDHSVTWVRQP